MISIKTIFCLDDHALAQMTKKYLISIYGKKNVKYKKNKYLYCKGNMPVMLNAHFDTVHYSKPKKIFYDPKAQIYFAPNEGLGADDRAGIYAILQIVNSNCKPYLLITHDEEIGGIGADQAIADFQYIPKINCIIALDRKNSNEAVFYDCNSESFQNWICSFGFKKAMGTFSDICILSPAWRINAVNVSIGYHASHTKAEHLDMIDLHKTINKVKNILKSKIPLFPYAEKEYKKIIYKYEYSYEYSSINNTDRAKKYCQICNHSKNRNDMICMYKTYDLAYDEYICLDCYVAENMFFCNECYQDFFPEQMSITKGICDDCYNKGGEIS